MAMATAAHSQESSSTPAAATVESKTYAEPGVPGGVHVDTITLTATVTDINAETREISIAANDGSINTIVASPMVANFDQIRVGDQIKVEMISELAIYLRKAGDESTAEDALIMAGAAMGEKPAGLIASTSETTAVVESIDLENHTATLRTSAGAKTIKVRDDVDLTQVAIGDEVVFQTTDAVAISVETP